MTPAKLALLHSLIVLALLCLLTYFGIRFLSTFDIIANHESLAGSLIGAAGTIFAGWLAWSAVQHQMNIDARRKSEREFEAKEAATIALIQLIHVVGILRLHYLAAPRANPHQLDAIEASVSPAHILLAELERGFSANELASELNIEDRKAFTMVYWMIRNIIAISRSPKLDTPEAMNDMRLKLINRLEKCAAAFDTRLTEALTTFSPE